MKTASLGKGGESDFQSYQIIRSKYPVFDKENLQGIKETGKYGPFKGKRNQQKNLMADILDRYKHLKDGQTTNGKCGKSQENNV